MITNYIPNTCKYSVNNLKKVVHIFSESENVIHIDNGEAYVTSGITDFQTIYATSVDFAESTSYDDRFKFEKQITVTVDGFLKLDSLNEKYYLVLEDENHTMWLVNADFPSFVTYTYTLSEGVDETVFTFNVLSNFPTLKLNASINNSYECKDYSLANVKELKMNLKENCTIDHVNHIIYDSSNTPYYIVKFNEGSLKVEETYDGFNVTTTIQFNINFDDYKASWHYNLLEYQDNKYVAVTDHLACGFEMGLIPSYNVQGSSQKGQGDIVTITLVGTSQKGSEWAETWTEATLIPEYVWLLTDEWSCLPRTQYRWTPSGYTCIGYDKYQNNILEESEDGVTWTVVIPEEYSASTLIEVDSIDCGYIPPVFDGKWLAIYEGGMVVQGLCDSTSAITNGEISKNGLVSVTIGPCVTTIDDSTFMYATGLTSVTIGENVTTIGVGAFASCSGLTEVTIPDSVTNIGAGAFSQCTGLTGVTVNATTPPTLGGSAFEYTDCPIYVPCPSLYDYKTASGWSTYADRIACIPFEGKYKFTLTDSSVVTGRCNSNYISSSDTTSYKSTIASVEIGDCIVYIDKKSFQSCINLASCIISNNCSRIGVEAFSGCTNLKNIVIPNRVRYIDYNAFDYCSGLTSVSLGTGLEVIGNYAFSNCTSLTSITIPNNVADIGGFAFAHCENLMSATIGSGSSIGGNAFNDCRSLTSVTISNGVRSVGDNAFRDCSGLTSVTIPDSVTAIGASAFTNCNSLTSVDMPNSVTSIGEGTFENCTGLTSIGPAGASVNIPSSVTSIGQYAFQNCTSLTSVTIPSGVTTIYFRAFIGSDNIRYLYYDANDEVKQAFRGKYSIETLVIGDNTINVSGAFMGCSGLTSVTIGNNVSSIENAFKNCTSLTSVVIPNNVTTINDAFEGCTSLTSINIPSGVTSIGWGTFSGCTSLTSVTIPSGVTTIGGHAFYNCSGLTSITCLATTPPTLDSDVFYGTTCTIYVPSGSVDAYKTANTWSTYATRIQAIP